MREYAPALIGVGGTLIGTLFGTLLGWYLSKPRAKLSFFIKAHQDDECPTPHELRTKTSDSDYCIVCYNNSDKPLILGDFNLSWKKHTITGFGADITTIKPYDSFTYVINMQEYDNILFHAKEKKINTCDVLAFDVSGKKYKSKLDLTWPWGIQINSENMLLGGVIDAQS